MLIIVGKSASGKTTMVQELCKRGYKQLVTYTTRPRRKNEPTNSYHFISENDFKQKIIDGFFAEHDSYIVTTGKWYYGSAKEDYINADDKTVVILNPQGYAMIRDNLDIPFKSIYLYSNLATIRERLKKRGDNKEEIERRVACDRLDFKEFWMKVDRVVFNNKEDSVKDVADKIVRFVEKI